MLSTCGREGCMEQEEKIELSVSLVAAAAAILVQCLKIHNGAIFLAFN